MAKKDSKPLSKALSFISEFDPDGSIIKDYAPIDNATFVNTGNYILNAHFSGSILKGVPIGKIITISGDPKAGKSYVMLNMAREVQKAGFIPIYVESEQSHDKDRFVAQGIDITQAWITQPETVQQLIKKIAPMTEKGMKLYNAGRSDEIPKYCIFIDSFSGLLPTAQMNSATNKGEYKSDFGSGIQEFTFLMNILTLRLGKLGWGCVVSVHNKIEETHISGRTYIKRRPKGGQGQIFLSSVVSMMWKKDERDEDDKSKITGIQVFCDVYESRYTKHRPISFFLPNDRPMNPLDGLMEYVTWETCKIGKGKWIEMFDVITKLRTKKVIAPDAKSFTPKHLESLSKADSEFIDDILAALVADDFVKPIKDAPGWEMTKKYDKHVEAGIIVLGHIPIPNPGSPRYIVGHLVNQLFTFDELMANEDGKIFTQPVLKAIDIYVKADFEIGAMSKFEEQTNGKDNDEDDYFK